MRKVVLILISFVWTFSAEAQQQTTAEDFKAVAAEETRQWQENLQLSEPQFLTIKQINERRQQELTTVREKFRYNLASRDSAVLKIEGLYDAAFSGVMSQKQFAAYLELQGRHFQDKLVPKSQEAIITGNTSQPVKPSDRNSQTVSEASETKDQVLSTDSSRMISLSEQEKNKKSKPAGETEVKVKEDVLKVQTPDGEMKFKEGEEKVKSEDGTKYKAETGNGKTKIKIKAPEQTAR